jgi:hypothetical protein
MAVPSSGSITMLGVAQERKYGAYGFGTISSPITMFDLLNGGGLNNFPLLNDCPQQQPPSYSMIDWYGYNQTASCGTCNPIILRFSDDNPFEACTNFKGFGYYTTAEDDAPWATDSPIYLDAACTNPAPNGYYSNGQEFGHWFNEVWMQSNICMT